MRALYRASQAGVPIELVVRGICVYGQACPAFPKPFECALSLAVFWNIRESTGFTMMAMRNLWRQCRLDGA